MPGETQDFIEAKDEALATLQVQLREVTEERDERKRYIKSLEKATRYECNVEMDGDDVLVTINGEERMRFTVEWAAANAVYSAYKAAERRVGELVRGHNARGSDGPCDCDACRWLAEGPGGRR